MTSLPSASEKRHHCTVCSLTPPVLSPGLRDPQHGCCKSSFLPPFHSFPICRRTDHLSFFRVSLPQVTMGCGSFWKLPPVPFFFYSFKFFLKRQAAVPLAPAFFPPPPPFFFARTWIVLCLLVRSANLNLCLHALFAVKSSEPRGPVM